MNLEKLATYEEKYDLEKGDFVNFKLEMINSIKSSRKGIIAKNLSYRSTINNSAYDINSCNPSPINQSPR